MNSAREIVHGFRLVDLFPDAKELTRTRFRALCRFHEDSTPSLVVTKSDIHGWRAHCFACGWDGNVFDVLRELEGLDFKAALARLGAGDVGKYAPQPARHQAAFVLACDFPGCGLTVPVEKDDVPYVGITRHISWEFAPDFVGALCPTHSREPQARVAA